MTDTDPVLDRVRAAARAHAEAVRTTQRFLDRVTDPDDPAVLAEYATLLQREKETAGDRADAVAAAGFEPSSIGGA